MKASGLEIQMQPLACGQLALALRTLVDGIVTTDQFHILFRVGCLLT